jgi:hypothetical protein
LRSANKGAEHLLGGLDGRVMGLATNLFRADRPGDFPGKKYANKNAVFLIAMAIAMVIAMEKSPSNTGAIFSLKGDTAILTVSQIRLSMR